MNPKYWLPKTSKLLSKPSCTLINRKFTNTLFALHLSSSGLGFAKQSSRILQRVAVYVFLFSKRQYAFVSEMHGASVFQCSKIPPLSVTEFRAVKHLSLINVMHVLIYRQTLNLQTAFPCMTDVSSFTSTGLSKADSNSSLIHPRPQLQKEEDRLSA